MPQEHQQPQQQRLHVQLQRFWKPPILQAFGKAVAIWMLVYLVTVHLYVAWKWDSHAGIATTTRTTSALNDTAAAAAMSLEEDSALLDVAQLERLEQLTIKLQEEIARTKELQWQVREVTLQIQQANAKMKSSSEQQKDAAASHIKLLFAAQQSTSADEPNMHRPTHLEALWKLLHRNNDDNNQSNPQDSMTTAAAALQDQATFRQMVRLASNDLVRNIQLQNDVDWAALKLALDSILLSSTSDVADTDNSALSDDTVCSPDTATDKDLQDRVEQVRNMLKKRRKGRVIQESDNDNEAEEIISLPVAFPQTLERLEQYIEEQRVILQQGATKEQDSRATTKATSTSKECMRSQDVLPWLEAGLDAIHRRKDLRQAILYAIEESSDTSSDGIILDAELNESSTTTNKNTDAAGAVSHPQSLRQALDGPFLADSMVRWINVVLDCVSGYNDRFDQFMDQLAAKEGNSNIGQVIVTRLLKASGRFSLPDVVKGPLKQQR